MPLTVSSAVGAHTIVGERERGSGEFLAHSPATERQIYLGKLMASLIPGYFTAAMGFFLYSMVVNLIVGPKLGGWFFPTTNWWILMLWVLPPFIALALAVILAISARVSSAAAAQQASALVTLPLIIIAYGVSSGTLFRGAAERVHHRRPRLVRRDLRVVARLQGRLPRTPPRHGRRLIPSWRQSDAPQRAVLTPKRRVPGVYESFATVWERVADAVPDVPAVVQGDLRVSYREVEDRAARLAAALAGLGVGRDTHVALFLHNCPEYMECLFALSKLRAVPANVNFRYLGTELAFLVDNADAEVLVYHCSLRDRVEDARDRMPGVRHVIEIDDDHGDSGYEQLLRDHEPAARIERSGDDTLLWYTGGTTGLPKGVLWHQGTLLGYGLIAAYAPAGRDAGPVRRAADRRRDALARAVLPSCRCSPRRSCTPPRCTRPTPHSRSVAPSCCSSAGASRATPCAATIQRERPSVLEIVGDVLMRRIARAATPPTHAANRTTCRRSGASTTPARWWSAPLKDALLSRGTMHVYDSLGSSEAVGFGVALTTGPGQSETGGFKLGPNARLLTADDRDVVPGSGEAGVLAVHTSCAVAYYKDPERSAITFRSIDGTPHAMPGDYATVDTDGTLTLLGRGSNCINSGGEKVWPEEVEEVLKEHPGVTDAVVMGVPDDEWGEIVATVVSVAPNDDPPDADALGEWIGARLAGYKRPRRFVFTDEVGRNTVGKLDYEWARRALA